ncbi:MAG: c-type cytochrome [Planctomycetota bacterium]|jgi:mono/diheme cytochrome c family protein
MQRILILMAPAILLAVAIAEEPKKPDKEAIERGKKLFADTQGDDYPSCAQCHSILPEEKERKEAKVLGPGGTLFGSARRAGWRNSDKFKDVVDASQYCAKKWQERKYGLKAAQAADLKAYLWSIAGKKALPKRKVQRKPKLIKDFEGGDAKRGEKLTQKYCTGCHGEENISFLIKPRGKKKLLIARKIRGYDKKLKFKPWSGTMSYYTTDRLSDKEMRDIIAYGGK